jgi:HAD superfamily hydrolase (TIGR01509 family)
VTDDLAHLARPDAVIFDLDGTLVDTVPARIAGWAEVLAAEGIEVHADRIAPMIGIDGRRLAREAAATGGRTLDDAAAERIDHAAGERFDIHNSTPRALPGARDALDRLDDAGLTWAIATSSRAAQVRGSVAALGLARDPRIVDGSRVAHAKPAPDLLLLAAEEVGVDPGRTWYVGDATWDMRAAVAAGMVPIAVLAGSAVDADALRDAGARVVLDTLDGLRLPD